MDTKSVGSKRMISVTSLSNYERAEFISAKTDTKQRLGELFIYDPTKLEMFGLRTQVVSTRIPKFEHPKPLFELDYEPDKVITHAASQTSFDCQKCNHSMSKMIQPKTSMEQLHLSAPSLVAEPKHEMKKFTPKHLESHIARRTNKDLPPILQYSFVQPPPFIINSAKGAVKEQKSIGKLSQGRLAKKFDSELVKVIQQELNKELHKMENEIQEKGYSFPLKHQNLKRLRQSSLSKTIKQEKQILLLQKKKSDSQLYSQKEKEINQIIFGNHSPTIQELL